MTGPKRVDGVLESPLDALQEAVLTGARVDMKVLGERQRGEIVHELMRSFASQSYAKDIAWVKLGLLWSFVMKNRIYKFCGPHINNANNFLRELDIGVGRREIQNYAKIARVFGSLIQTTHVPIRKLVMIASVVEDESEEVVHEWFDKAVALPTGALKDELAEFKGQTPKDACSHPQEFRSLWFLCEKCGAWLECVQESPATLASAEEDNF